MKALLRALSQSDDWATLLMPVIPNRQTPFTIVIEINLYNKCHR